MRLFIAVDPGSQVREALVREIERLTPEAPKARWLKPDALHLTLAFLGEVAEEKLPPLQALVTEVAARHPAFTLGASGGGAFGAKSHPRVLWVGLDGELDTLRALQRELAEGLAKLGHALEDRPFSPHLTLARAKDPRGDRGLAACAKALEGVRRGEGRVEKLILFQSKLGPGGAKHTPLAEAPLRG